MMQVPHAEERWDDQEGPHEHAIGEGKGSRRRTADGCDSEDGWKTGG